MDSEAVYSVLNEILNLTQLLEKQSHIFVMEKVHGKLRIHFNYTYNLVICNVTCSDIYNIRFKRGRAINSIRQYIAQYTVLIIQSNINDIIL